MFEVKCWNLLNSCKFLCCNLIQFYKFGDTLLNTVNLQVLTLAFFADCAKANPKKPQLCKPSFSSKSNTDPVQTPNVNAPNPFDSTLAAEIDASIVGGAVEPPFFTQDYFEPLRANSVAPVSYWNLQQIHHHGSGSRILWEIPWCAVELIDWNHAIVRTRGSSIGGSYRSMQPREKLSETKIIRV